MENTTPANAALITYVDAFAAAIGKIDEACRLLEVAEKECTETENALLQAHGTPAFARLCSGQVSYAQERLWHIYRTLSDIAAKGKEGVSAYGSEELKAAIEAYIEARTKQPAELSNILPAAAIAAIEYAALELETELQLRELNGI